MPPTQSDLITNGNLEAQDFIKQYGFFTRALDDCIDHNDWRPETILNVCALGNRVYSHPFFRRHASQLQITILIVTSLYAVSVKFEREPELWKRRYADCLRHADVALMSTIALLTGGGFEAMEKVSRVFLAVSHIDHKLRHGDVA